VVHGKILVHVSELQNHDDAKRQGTHFIEGQGDDEVQEILPIAHQNPAYPSFYTKPKRT